MIHLRYEDRDWQLVYGMLVTRSGQAIRLCSERLPVLNSRPVVRKGEAEWSVSPISFHGDAFYPVLDACFILLTGSPMHISDFLSTL